MINKEKILAGVRACINPHISICQECPYWNNGDKQCEELRMDIVEAIDSGVFAPKAEAKSIGPFNNLKFYLKDAITGEIEVKYICEDCGKIMKEPHYWQYRMPIVVNGKKSTNRPGYYFYCEECIKKRRKIYE